MNLLKLTLSGRNSDSKIKTECQSVICLFFNLYPRIMSISKTSSSEKYYYQSMYLSSKWRYFEDGGGAVYDYAGKAGVNQDWPRLAQRGHHTLYKRTQVCKGKRQCLASPGVFLSCNASQLKRKDNGLVDETSQLGCVFMGLTSYEKQLSRLLFPQVSISMLGLSKTSPGTTG